MTAAWVRQMSCVLPSSSDRHLKRSEEVVQVWRWTSRLWAEGLMSRSSSSFKNIDLTETVPTAGLQNRLCWSRAGERLGAVLLTRADFDRAGPLLQACKLCPEAANLPGLSIVPRDSTPNTKGAISWEYPGSPPEYRWLRVVQGTAATLSTLIYVFSLFFSSFARYSVPCGFIWSRPFCTSKLARARRIRKVFAIWASNVSQIRTVIHSNIIRKKYLSSPTFEI